MKNILQRVHNASVKVDNKIVGEIDKGILTYVCFAPQDLESPQYTDNLLKKMCDKIINLRIFADSMDKPNKSLVQIQGSLLVVPNFTLYANCKKGMRPSFSSGIAANDALHLFTKFLVTCNKSISTQAGIFGSKMCIESSADGPFNIILEM